jgi:hypothetical protein
MKKEVVLKIINESRATLWASRMKISRLSKELDTINKDIEKLENKIVKELLKIRKDLE